jgi:hypothetical protein
MHTQKRQKLTCKLVGISKDFFGVFTISLLCNGEVSTFTLYSEFLVRKIERLLYYGESDKAINMLKHLEARQ